ncbi:MAG TPA: SCO family protein [Kofleriaceae bacterium]|jgi:protein SCO1/2|nr:SCO family protein [Kofleriaceae bacterium]
MAKDTPDAPTPKQWGTVSPREALRRRFFPDVTLVTHEGKKVRLYEDLIKDKCVMMNFMYARCTGICSPVTANLRRAQMLLKDHIGRDIFMYSFSLKPKEDSPADLKAYVQERKLGPGWTFLTGHPDDMERVRVQLGFNDSDPKRDADVTNHTGIVRYGNEALMLWAAFPGLQLPQAIARSMMWVAAPGKADPKFLRRE